MKADRISVVVGVDGSLRLLLQELRPYKFHGSRGLDINVLKMVMSTDLPATWSSSMGFYLDA